jgi:hypothetical protein
MVFDGMSTRAYQYETDELTERGRWRSNLDGAVHPIPLLLIKQTKNRTVSSLQSNRKWDYPILINGNGSVPCHLFPKPNTRLTYRDLTA